ncbi:MAG: MerR family transcriptional regulator [Melioribacteraceae bacterium]|jgi:MerR family transcriptional regulator/heat shock protein HspR|nr:MerR family transcriptional regulator [Melioribacteraceae bacterium]
MSEDLNNPKYTISNAANLLEISVHTMRMYEREGLIIPFKKTSGQRLYSDQDIERVKCIRHSIKEEKLTIQGIRKILSLIPCWAILSCSQKDRENCSAYDSFSKPCWMHSHKDNVCVEKDCRVCEVYNSFGTCESIKNKLKVLLP